MTALQERDPACPYHLVWPCGNCDDCDDVALHPGMVIPLCPGWSNCTCLAGTHGHSTAAVLEYLQAPIVARWQRIMALPRPTRRQRRRRRV